jgi:anti-sigma regulatory factor (Ser/Thr protein kinase)
MEAFLRSQGTADETLMDISIATTEAMENAVKYSDHSPIEVSYSVENGVFHIMIKNRLSEVRLEKDIEAGKYTSTTTLMRGMMVMVKLFDEMDIEILEEEKLAVFQAHKRIK